jgi:NAD(P)-dependent dehydrogenase (short-subunit alcohol dehydrogenase family)
MSTAQLSGQVAVVNGAGRGIGEAVSRQLAAAGAVVAILDIDGEQAAKTAHEITSAGNQAIPIACDIAREAEVVDAFRQVDAVLGSPTILVNNAGVNPRQSPMDVDLETWNRVLAVNITGYFLCAREAARRMHERGGAIVNVSSIAGTTALGRGNLAYAVSKGGVDALTRELAVEWGRYGIRVNAVAPCQVETTGFVANEEARTLAGDTTAADYRKGLPLGRLALPDEIASAIVYLASDSASMITGTVLAVDGGNLALNAGGTIGQP